MTVASKQRNIFVSIRIVCDLSAQRDAMTVTETQGMQGRVRGDWRWQRARIRPGKQFQQASDCQRSQRETIITGASHFLIQTLMTSLW